MAKVAMIGVGYFKRAVKQHRDHAERYGEVEAVEAYDKVLELVDEHLNGVEIYGE